MYNDRLPHGVQGYKLLVIQPGGYKVMTSRSITFSENSFPFKEKLISSFDHEGAAETEKESFIPGFRRVMSNTELGGADEEFEQMSQSLNPTLDVPFSSNKVTPDPSNGVMTQGSGVQVSISIPHLSSTDNFPDVVIEFYLQFYDNLLP